MTEPTAPRPDSVAPDAAQSLQKLEQQVFAIDRTLSLETQQSLFVQALKLFGRILKTCEATGIPYTSLVYWRQNNPAFDASISEWQGGGMVESLISASYWTALTAGPKGYKDRELLLRAFGGDTFKERLEVNQSVTVQVTLQQARGIADLARERLKVLNVAPVEAVEVEDAVFVEQGM